MYGKLTVVFLNFLQFNMSGSAVYGAHPWHWYLSQGLPALLGSHLVFIAVAFLKQRDYPRQLLGVVVMTVLFFSLVAHKEFRFVQHLTPVFMIWAGLGLHWISRHVERPTLYTLIMMHCLLNTLAGVYIGFFHQRGTVTVTTDLANWVESGDQVVFLTPCHATPFHSHIHHPEVQLHFLDCSPDLKGSGQPHEEARFYADPVGWWEHHVAAREVPVSEYVVVFEESLVQLHEVLLSQGYQITRKYFFAHLLLDDRLTSHLLLYKKTF